MFKYLAQPRRCNIVIKEEVPIFLSSEIKYHTDFSISDSGMVMGYRVDSNGSPVTDENGKGIMDYCFNLVRESRGK